MTLRSTVYGLALLLASLAPALDTGWIYAGTSSDQGGGDASWSNATSATGNNLGTYASTYLDMLSNSNLLRLTGFDFSGLPSEATVNGVEVALYMLGASDFTVAARLVILGSPAGSTKSYDVPVSASEFTVGNTSDTWSMSLSAAQLKASNSGVQIQVTSDFDGGEARVYRVGIKVHYTATEPAPWYSISWSHRVRGHIDAAYVNEAVPVVPIWVPAEATGWFGAVRSDGADIRVTADDGVSLLEHYLVKIDTAAPYCLLLVDVDGVADPVVDGYFHVYGGNAGATSTSSGSSVFSGSGYAAYWTLTGAAGLADITGNGHHLTANNSPPAGQSGPRTGLESYDLNGTTQYLSRSASPVSGPPFTFEAIIRSDSATARQAAIALGTSSSDSVNLAIFRAAGDVTGDPVQLALLGNGGSVSTAQTSSGYSAATWHYIAGSRSGSTAGTTTATIGGGSAGTNSTTVNSFSALNRVAVGAANNLSTYQYFDGKITAPAISSTARSQAYMATMSNAWMHHDFIAWANEEAAHSAGAWWLPLALE